MGTMTLDERLAIAKDRGRERGAVDFSTGYRNDAPLSGEWAGESITEILGDLFDEDYDGEDVQWLCDEYEAGYDEAFV